MKQLILLPLLSLLILGAGSAQSPNFGEGKGAGQTHECHG